MATEKILTGDAAKSEETRERRAISIHIGMALLSRYTYGQPAVIGSCERDAEAMYDIAHASGFSGPIARNSNFIHADLEEFFENAKELEAGDSLLITFSGHGMTGRRNGTLHEAWCLYDFPFYDFELHKAINDLSKGVEVLIISDSCDSGGLPEPSSPRRMAPAQQAFGNLVDATSPVARRLGPVKRFMGGLNPSGTIPLVDLNTPSALKNHFDIVASRFVPLVDRGRKAHAVFIAACGPNQDTFAGATARELSTFTQTLVNVWNKGAFEGSFDYLRGLLTPTVPSSIPEVVELDPIDSQFSRRGPFRLREL